MPNREVNFNKHKDVQVYDAYRKVNKSSIYIYTQETSNIIVIYMYTDRKFLPTLYY